jgi:hypothetical protein
LAHQKKGRDAMATTTPPVRSEETGEARRLAKYRAMRSTLDRSSRGDKKAAKEEGQRITQSLREERALANSVLRKK